MGFDPAEDYNPSALFILADISKRLRQLEECDLSGEDYDSEPARMIRQSLAINRALVNLQIPLPHVQPLSLCSTPPFPRLPSKAAKGARAAVAAEEEKEAKETNASKAAPPPWPPAHPPLCS